MRAQRAGFTLFEVAISLLIVAGAVLSVALAFPVGIRAQRLARFRILASAKALEIVDCFADDQHLRKNKQVESAHPAQNTSMQWQPDLDREMDDPVLGLLPLPSAIARRIDSDGDDIARLIDAGGRVFYCSPNASEGLYDQVAAGYYMTYGVKLGVQYQAVAQNQTLLIGILGYAQQDALPHHPCLAWPYHDFYPSPAHPRERDEWHEQSWPAQTEFDALYTALSCDDYEAKHGDATALDDAIAKAQSLVVATGVATTASLAGPVPTPPPALPATWTDTDANASPPPWRILAMSYLAQAAMARTGGDCSPPATAAQQQYAIDCHEACLAWTARYASTSPYDWGAPRPLNRQTAMDFPLLEYDLFGPLITAPSPDADVSWPICCALKPGDHATNAWRSHGWWGWDPMPDNRADIAASWGDNAHFNLTARFDAAERTRRIVCWSASWQAFEDFEELPAEAFSSDFSFIDSLGHAVSGERTGYPPDAWFHFADAGRTTLFDQALHTVMGSPRWWLWNTTDYKAGYLGIYGVDRNGNGRLDRGPLPASARIRAQTIVAYDVYDKRLIAGLSH